MSRYFLVICGCVLVPWSASCRHSSGSEANRSGIPAVSDSGAGAGSGVPGSVAGSAGASSVAGAVPGQPYVRYETTDSLGRAITFYLSEEPDVGTPLPLVAYVHGSGTTSHFVRRDDRVRGANGHSTVRDLVAGRARLLLVEKPGVAYLDDPERPDGAGASPDFRREHVLDRWAEAIRAAIRASVSLPSVDGSRILVAGHSEGGLVAARVAALDPAVSHVALLAGGGPTQLYDLLALARSGEFFTRISEDDAAAREAHVLDAWRRIRASPDAADSTFFGHSYRRWHSFLTTSPIEQLNASRASVYLAQGEADRAVRPETMQMACAALLAHDPPRDVVCDAVAHADHSFATTDGSSGDGWLETWARVVDWYLAGP